MVSLSSYGNCDKRPEGAFLIRSRHVYSPYALWTVDIANRGGYRDERKLLY